MVKTRSRPEENPSRWPGCSLSSQTLRVALSPLGKRNTLFFVSGVTSFHHINTTQPKQHVRSIQPKTSTPMLAVMTQAVSIEPVLRSPLLRRRPNHVPNYSTIFLGLLYRPGLLLLSGSLCHISRGVDFLAGGVGWRRLLALLHFDC